MSYKVKIIIILSAICLALFVATNGSGGIIYFVFASLNLIINIIILFFVIVFDYFDIVFVSIILLIIIIIGSPFLIRKINACYALPNWSRLSYICCIIIFMLASMYIEAALYIKNVAILKYNTKPTFINICFAKLWYFNPIPIGDQHYGCTHHSEIEINNMVYYWSFNKRDFLFSELKEK